MAGDGADAEPASTVAAEIVAAGGAAIADSNDVAIVAGAQALVDAAVEQFGRVDILINNAGIIRWAGFPEADADNLAQPPRRARRRLVQHHPRGVAAHGRTGLRPHRHDDFGGDVRTARQPLLRDREGGRHRAHAQPHDRRRRARHQGQPDRARGLHAHGGPARRPGATPRWRRSSSRRWSRSSPTRTARSAARSTPPVRVASRASSSPTTEGYVHASTGADDRGHRRATGRRSTTRRATHVPADLMSWSAAFMAHLPH